MESKQIRISKADYDDLVNLCDMVEGSKSDVLRNLIRLGVLVAEGNGVKIIYDDGEEKQVMIPALSRSKNAG